VFPHSINFSKIYVSSKRNKFEEVLLISQKLRVEVLIVIRGTAEVEKWKLITKQSGLRALHENNKTIKAMTLGMSVIWKPGHHLSQDEIT
jgi:hypothetical protein